MSRCDRTVLFLVVPALSALALLAPGCAHTPTPVAPEPGLERMVEQPRVSPYRASRYFSDGAGMRTPPQGAVARDTPIPGPATTGSNQGRYLVRAPFTLDLPMLRRGQERYAVACAVCHGLRGDGQSVVAAHMALVAPRNLLEGAYRTLPIGQIFQVIRSGYGMMPSYAPMLDVRESWEVAAYVQVLQRCDAMALKDLSPAQRRQAQEQLP